MTHFKLLKQFITIQNIISKKVNFFDTITPRVYKIDGLYIGQVQLKLLSLYSH